MGKKAKKLFREIELPVSLDEKIQTALSDWKGGRIVVTKDNGNTPLAVLTTTEVLPLKDERVVTVNFLGNRPPKQYIVS